MIRVFLISILALIPVKLHAADPAEAKGISIRLFAVALTKNQGPVSTLVGDSRGKPFEVPTLNLSPVQAVTAREFSLISSTAPTDTPQRPLASIRLPDLGKDFRIILVPANDETYKTIVIRGNDPKFAHGDFFFVNLSTHEMLGSLGSVKLAMKPGQQELFTPAGDKSKNFFEVKFAYREEKKLMPLTNTCWPVVKDNRAYVIFFNGKNGRPSYRAVDEFMALPSAPTP